VKTEKHVEERYERIDAILERIAQSQERTQESQELPQQIAQDAWTLARQNQKTTVSGTPTPFTPA